MVDGDILFFVRAQYVNTFQQSVPTTSLLFPILSTLATGCWRPPHRHFNFYSPYFLAANRNKYLQKSKIVSLCRHEIYVQSCSLPGINSTAPGKASKNPNQIWGWKNNPTFNWIDPIIEVHLFVRHFVFVFEHRQAKVLWRNTATTETEVSQSWPL